MEFIKSTQNTLIKRISALKDGKARKVEGMFIAEGVRIVLDAGITPKYLFVDEAHVDFARSWESKCSVYSVSKEVIAKLSDTKSPQGVVAVYDIPKNRDYSMTGERAIILDGVQDPGNVGTIIRTAVASGYDIYLINCADIYSPKVVRSTMSGVFKSNMHVVTYEQMKDILAKRGAKLYSLDMGGQDIFETQFSTPYALLVGNEAQGISEWAKTNSDYIVSIPMRETIESLNAGVSAGIAMYVTAYKK